MNGKVVVLGAGPAGLSAAWKLSRSGVPVHLLEAEGYVGGLSHTIQRGDYLFDFGPHRFHTDNPAVLAEIESLVGEMPTRTRKTRVYFMGNYYDYPLSAGNLLSSLSPWLAATCFAGFVATWARNRLRPSNDDSFESWVVNRFGRRLYSIYFGPYTAKVWGRDPARLSASWAAQRVAVVDLWDLTLRTLGLRRGYNNFHHSPFKTDFHYPLDGVGLIYDRMAEEIQKNGGAISLRAKVRQVRVDGDRVESVLADTAGGAEMITADHFVSTIPIPELVRALNPAAAPEALTAAASLDYRGMIFLFLALDRESVSDDHWIYIPEGKFIFNRVSEMKNFTPLAAPPGKTSLCVEISCDVDDELWGSSDDELYRRSVAGLVKCGLIRGDEVLDHFIVRARHAYPTYDLHFESNLARLAYHLSSFGNMVVCGRQGLFRYINQDHAIEMGLCAADELLKQQVGTLVSRVGAERVYFG